MLKRSLEQEKIFEEIKNGNGNLLVNAKAGTGKCLGKNTLVVKSTGERVKVQDLVVGDKLMGDDGTHRTILSTTIGKGKLYKVTVPSTNEFFICNDEHILTCTLGRNTIPFDISINDVINNYEKSNKNIYETFTKIKLYRHIYNIESDNTNKTNYYNIGHTFFDKDYKYKSITTTLENRYDIISGLIDNYFIPIKSTFKIKNKITKNITLFNTLLRSCGYEYISGSKVIKGDFSKLKLRNKEYYDYLSINRGINNIETSSLYFNIEEYKENGDYYGFTLDGNGRFLINDFIVTHNTTTIVNSLEAIEEGKSIMMLAFNKHIANELKERVPKRDKLFVSTTHSLGWGALRKKYKNATVDFDKAFKVIRKKLTRWNIREVDDVDQYINMIKNLVDLCRVTLTTKRSFIPMLAQNHGYQINDEDARRVLSVMEDMYNDTETFDFVDMIYLPAIDNKIWLFPNDYVFVDECVDGRSHILLKDDKIERIQDLYEKHIDKNGNIIDKDKLPYVLSYNVEKQKNEYRRISNIMYKGRKRVTYISIVNTYMFATPSHLFYTTEGWREVKDLKYGDAIISNEYNRFNNAHYPDDEQVDFLYSYLLCFGLYESSNNRYKFRFYIKNKDKRRFNFINKITPLYVKANVDRIKMTEYSTVMFYLNDKTYNKEYLIKNMTIKQLAISYIVSYKYFKDIDKYGFFISVNTFDEMVYAKELFEQRFGRIFDIKNYIKSSYLIPRDQDWFFDLIKEYIPKSFKDIISEKYWPETGKYTYKPNYSQQYCGTVGRIRPENKMADVYDITVEDNNNYFITSVDSTSFRKRSKDMIVGFLTHNCQDYNRAQQYMLNKIVKKDKGRLISVGDPHQSIYFFNGSSSDAFNWFREKENTIELPLTTSYRSAKSIIQLAQTLVPQIQFKHDAEDGEVREGSVLELAKPGDFVLARKNKPLVILLFDFLKRNQVATIRGNDIGNKIAETLKKYKSISELDKGLTTKLNDMRDNLINNLGVIDYRSDQRYISLDDNIGIIRFLMSNTGTIEKIIHKISLIFSDNPQGIILSTIHKSKGLESDTVFIIKPDEIRLKTPVAEVAQQEKNLEYIAYTRAKNTLIFDREWTDERD